MVLAHQFQRLVDVLARDSAQQFLFHLRPNVVRDDEGQRALKHGDTQDSLLANIEATGFE
ncbi:hypothetical protein [Mesorhizobium sp. L103C119B0]|uniref:hypothetical protein n=1 Tax=Mesorhizobium sp. L103C119B0 TaxID=1287085 RepID=UPI0012DC2435|nr:hypothetical protein [Mesorhizobium sp. L103C119B0]